MLSAWHTDCVQVDVDSDVHDVHHLQLTLSNVFFKVERFFL